MTEEVSTRQASEHVALVEFSRPPQVVGHQPALELLYTGVRLRGEEAHAIGLCDRLVESERLREEALALAEERG